MIAGGYDDAEMAFTSVAARKFASPSCQQVRALSSRFSGSGCPESEGPRLSGERVITRADSFHSASTSTSLSDAPLDIPLGYGSQGSQESGVRMAPAVEAASPETRTNSRFCGHNGITASA